jgi:hypothetical protein
MPWRKSHGAGGEIGIGPGEVSTWLKHAAEAAVSEGTDEAETLATLHAEWGGAFEKKLEAARLVTKRIGPAFERQLDETGLGNDPRLIKRLAEVGAPLLEAHDRYMRTKFNPDYPVNRLDHRDHAQAVAEMERLRVKVYGGK